jgi:hypothetical protein
MAPSRVIAVVDKRWRANPPMSRVPGTVMRLLELQAGLIRYNIRCWLANLAEDEWADSEATCMPSRRWHASAEMPIPRHSVHESRQRVRRNAESAQQDAGALRSLELLRR